MAHSKYTAILFANKCQFWVFHLQLVACSCDSFDANKVLRTIWDMPDIFQGHGANWSFYYEFNLYVAYSGDLSGFVHTLMTQFSVVW